MHGVLKLDAMILSIIKLATREIYPTWKLDKPRDRGAASGASETVFNSLHIFP